MNWCAHVADGGAADIRTQVAWIGALSALGGAIIGGLLGFLGQYLLRRSERTQLARQLASGLAGEIAALVEIVERRKYVKMLRDAGGDPKAPLLEIAVTRNYFKVFDVNANQMGLLGGDRPQAVTSFYVRATALSEDFDVISGPTFRLYDVETRQTYYREMAALLEETMALGNQAIAELRK